MSKIHTRIGAVLIALTAAFATVSVGAASASDAVEVDRGVCRDGARLFDYYLTIGDHATASALLTNLINMGCLD